MDGHDCAFTVPTPLCLPSVRGSATATTRRRAPSTSWPRPLPRRAAPPPETGNGRAGVMTMVDQVAKVSPVPTETTPKEDSTILELTEENVELVLNEMRPYLMADGGNVSIAEIDGASVRLQLEGACGSCPSSTMTMTMGLERRLRERIPEIVEVLQVEPEGPELTPEGIEKTLDEVRPFLNVAGGTIELIALNLDSAVPTARLKMTGSGSAINSVKVEIVHRLKRNWIKLANVTFE